MNDPKAAREAFLEIVDNQIASNDPPETRQTFDRLTKSGWSQEDSKKLIAQCVAVELYSVMTKQEPFNEERFIKNLKNLPEEPFE